jgi:hypothetical protein
LAPCRKKVDLTNVVAIRNGAWKSVTEIRQNLFESVYVRAPGSPYGEGGPGGQGEQDTKHNFLKLVHSTINDFKIVDVLLACSRGAKLLADCLDSVGRSGIYYGFSVVVLSPADIEDVMRIFEHCRSTRTRLVIAVSFTDIMDVPCATHPNLSVRSFEKLVTIFSSAQRNNDGAIVQLHHASSISSSGLCTLMDFGQTSAEVAHHDPILMDIHKVLRAHCSDTQDCYAHAGSSSDEQFLRLEVFQDVSSTSDADRLNLFSFAHERSARPVA